MSDDPRARWRHRSLGVPRELTLSTGKLVCFEAGEGKPVVFLHGPFTNANVWRKVVAALSGGFRCIAIDLPYGSHTIPVPDADLSFRGLAEITVEALEQLGLDDVTLVGNDGGTAVAQVVAMTRPDLVGRLVLTDGGAYDNAPPRRYRSVLKAIAYAPLARELILGPLRWRPLRRLPFAQGWLTSRPVESATSDSWVLPALVDDGIYADARRMLRALDPALLPELARRLSDFTAPVLVAWSTKDQVYPPTHARRLADDFADARLVSIPNSGVLLGEEKPFELATHIAEFIRGTRLVPVTATAPTQKVDDHA